MIANSMLGYKHKPKALEKMRNRFKIKTNHPLSHTKLVRKIICKFGSSNPMFGKKHNLKTKLLMSERKSKKVYLYKKDMVLLKNLKNSVVAADHFKVHRGTIGRYIKSIKLFKGLYRITRTSSIFE
jgi:group I intron endonuclease